MHIFSNTIYIFLVSIARAQCLFPFLYWHLIRSIILTSGTLSPLSAFQEEIGIPFPVMLENKHIISASQVFLNLIVALIGFFF